MKKSLSHGDTKPVSKKKKYFFLACIQISYEKEEKLRQRTINLVLSQEDTSIVEADLQSLQKAAQQRIHQENNVEPSAVKDVVVLNIVLLAHSSESKFHASKNTIQ